MVALVIFKLRIDCGIYYLVAKHNWLWDLNLNLSVFPWLVHLHLQTLKQCYWLPPIIEVTRYDIVYKTNPVVGLLLAGGDSCEYIYTHLR